MNRHLVDTISMIQGKTSLDHFPLIKRCYSIGRIDEKRDWKPDIDLSPDLKISRRHARLFFQNNTWWLEDLGSTHGTKVGGVMIKTVTELKPSVIVEMGATKWMINPPNRRSERWGGMYIEFELVPAINYALYHCGFPILSNFVVKNLSTEYSEELLITIFIKGYSDPWVKKISRLAPDEKGVLEKITLPLYYEKLEGIGESRKARIELYVQNDLVSHEEISILGFYQWPVYDVYRKSLACFVQPSHPIVNTITLDAGSFLCMDDEGSLTKILKSDRTDKTDLVVKALYDCIATRYNIRYLPPPQSLEKNYQVIRPPHGVITDSKNRMGGGTCIDLALLFASCLENLQLQPLILLVRESEFARHAFVGCWKNISERFEPILLDKERLKRAVISGQGDQILLIETTGCTERFDEKYSFEEAVESAVLQLLEKDFLYAIDITASRQTVVPLQFPMSPQAIDIIRKAEGIARHEMSDKLETKHILYSLLKHRDKIVSLLSSTPLDLSALDPIMYSSALLNGPVKDSAPHPTINYRRVIEDARLAASDAGFPYVDEIHLWYAVLLSQSASVDRILEQVGTSRTNLKALFDKYYAWTKDVVQTYYEF